MCCKAWHTNRADQGMAYKSGRIISGQGTFSYKLWSNFEFFTNVDHLMNISYVIAISLNSEHSAMKTPHFNHTIDEITPVWLGSIDIILLCRNANQRRVCAARSKKTRTWPTPKDAAIANMAKRNKNSLFLVKMFYFLKSITGCSKKLFKFLWLAQNTASRCLFSWKEQLRLLLLLAFVLGVNCQGRKVRPEILQPLAFLGVLLVVGRAGSARADWGSRPDGIEAAVQN